MQNRRRTAIMRGQFKSAVKDVNEYLKFYMCEGDMSTWYVLLSGFGGDDDEFESGEYLVRVELPSDFPFNPPHFYFMTEQGVYGVGGKICISIGEFHKEDYRAALGVAGFCQQLVSGLVGWRTLGSGINLKKTSLNEKKTYAMMSRDHNYANHSDIMDNINESYANYSSRWDLTKIPKPLRIKLGLGEDLEDSDSQGK